ncbi:MAG: hypothetical protein ACOYBX_11990 [Mycobacterium sp.]
MTRTTNRRFASALGAAGIALAAFTFGSAPQALAEPNDGGCSSMAMPAGQADADAGNALTRAGQIAAASGPRSGGGSAAMTCPSIGHN